MSNLSFLTSVETETATSLVFPNITVCHPLYFDKYKMEGDELIGTMLYNKGLRFFIFITKLVIFSMICVKKSQLRNFA